MSTYFYYRCLQHEPPLVSEHEVTQHRDEYLQTAIDFASGKPLWQCGPWFASYVQEFATEWLQQHENCPIDVISENGDAVPIPGREKREAGT